MARQDKPEVVSLTAQEADALKARVSSKRLTDEDIKTITGLVTFSLWLQTQLSYAKLTIHRLRRLFGMTTEKKTLK